MTKTKLVIRKKVSKKRQFENIYDIITGTSFKDVATKELKKFVRGKKCEWDGDKNIISIGKHFKIALIIK